MVLYDIENYVNTPAKGMLHINLIDVDYLINKYGVDALKKDIPRDYVEYMEEELGNIYGHDPLDTAYYGSLQMGIETSADEKLLELIRKEVQDGNLFSKKALSEFNKEELEKLIKELFGQNELSSEELYKLRSYHMAKYVIDAIARAQKMQDDGYETGYFDVYTYTSIVDNLRAIGLDSNIKESPYFDEAVKDKVQ